MNKAEFVRRVKGLMVQHGFNQKKLCEQCGIKESTFSNYMKESDSRLPKIEDLASLASALGTTTDYLLGVSRKMEFPEIKTILADNSMQLNTEQLMELSSLLMFAYKRQEDYENTIGRTEDVHSAKSI